MTFLREPFYRPEGPIPFEPWHKDPIQLARLLRFLILIDQTPPDIPSFLERAETWESLWGLMQTLRLDE